MANHKRGKPKNSRAGCLMCKPHKANGAKDKEKASVKRKLQEDVEEEVEEEFGADLVSTGECDE